MRREIAPGSAGHALIKKARESARRKKAPLVNRPGRREDRIVKFRAGVAFIDSISLFPGIGRASGYPARPTSNQNRRYKGRTRLFDAPSSYFEKYLKSSVSRRRLSPTNSFWFPTNLAFRVIERPDSPIDAFVFRESLKNLLVTFPKERNSEPPNSDS